MNAAILTDLTKCVGCGACALACKQVNGLPGKVSTQLDAYTWTIVERRKGVYIRRQCMHCLAPTCASVCPVGALHRTEYGAVAYDAGKCIGCRYCIMACPFDVPKYQWDSPVPVIGKCIMCVNTRLARGKEPACTEICPAYATVFGERKDLLEEARRRIKEEPQRYINHIYGENEASGTSVMYISPIAFQDLGFKSNLMRQSYPELTWKIIEKVPDVVGIGGILLFGTMWVINRRMQLSQRTTEEEKDEEE